jgi:hypothetical protein
MTNHPLPQCSSLLLLTLSPIYATKSIIAKIKDKTNKKGHSNTSTIDMDKLILPNEFSWVSKIMKTTIPKMRYKHTPKNAFTIAIILHLSLTQVNMPSTKGPANLTS